MSLAFPVDLGPWFGRERWSWAAGRAVFGTPGTLAKTEASLHVD